MFLNDKQHFFILIYLFSPHNTLFLVLLFKFSFAMKENTDLAPFEIWSDRQNFHQLDHFSDAMPARTGAQSRPPTWLVWTQSPEPSPLLPRAAVAGSWSQKPEGSCDLNLGTLIWHMGILTSISTARINATPSFKKKKKPLTIGLYLNTSCLFCEFLRLIGYF